MASGKFDTIRQHLQGGQPFYATYGVPGQRELCPHILGYKAENGTGDADERVLCYQISGPHGAGWRCFDLTALTIAANLPPPADWHTPANYPNSPRWQNSVKNVKHQR